ncbi:ornithine carbamoyltransferase [Rhodothalassium salexigens DSM 2132]|uniref:Ornithine carbamoyltransferase n=1 Tax=Rhodothalassium salexigens DSM 2132 TaxID=1188247 RepID=A0A4R2PPT0_RHOSA|nr:ornithine carbamoyltransferase [Rhodothalassium salexigens]MBB4211143.1 ornithine carbamoyltransferase [Rhodothalassium salexigens DSM 2132]MBK1637484.1 ornithine carbamoyltransferase [Rhodothalassium salexigens DSM 2132]TCP36201.1 ornithine carbamoyltransferase [Rhodothalassium salexigens DSM 2132]
MDGAEPAVAAGTPRHFLDLAGLDAATVARLIEAADTRARARAGRFKAAPDDDAPLAGAAVACLFAKPSTRTRVSFDLAVRQLGGAPLTLDRAGMQTGRGEPLDDTARVLSRYVDAITFRAHTHGDLETLAGASDVPVVNALTDYSHPCQAIADMLTLKQRLGSLAGARIAWLGDGNNVAVSLVHAAVRLGASVRLAGPDGRMPDALFAWAAAQGGDVARVATAEAAVDGAQAVYTDTWKSMGDEAVDLDAFAPYRVSEALMARAPEAVFLHCLPAYRGQEVDAAVLEGPQSAVWDQAENRLHAQKAILLHCFDRL